MRIDLLYHEGPCIVVNKPTGLLTQAPAGIDSLETRVREYVAAREQITGNFYLGVPHRLDRPASGAVVLGRHAGATRRLARQFEERTVRKRYAALVHDADIPDQGTWIDHLRKIPGRSFVEVVADTHPAAKRAVLHYRVCTRRNGLLLLDVELETGRTHQIRVQAASRGMPILGDDQYGSPRPFGEPFADARERAIALHARHLEFEHPMTREQVGIDAEFPSIWEDWPAYWDSEPGR